MDVAGYRLDSVMAWFLPLCFFLIVITNILSAHATLRADYVIVGGGTAGCAIAARLCTKLPSKKFILLERAPPRDPETEFITRAPRNFGIGFENPSLAEVFPSLPNTGLNNRPVNLSTGNTLGGSSSINGGQFIVPASGTVEKWRIRGLSTQSSRPFYKRVFETLGVMAQQGNLQNIYAQEHLNAAIKSGLPKNPDPFDESPNPSSFLNRVTVDKRGFRVDSCTGYLTPALNGPCSNNLQLVQGVTVTRVLLRKRRFVQRYVAQGVEIVDTESRENKRKVWANKEVILSAGPYGSPKILQLSGIGPREVLRKAGVELKVDLPVGTRTQGRLVTLSTAVYTGVPLDPANNSTLLDDPATREMWERGEGGIFGQMSVIVAGRLGLDGYMNVFVASTPQIRDVPFLATSCIVNPSTFGFLRIKDSDPFTSPEVQASLLGNQKDLNRAIRCLGRAVRILQSFEPEFGIIIQSPPNGAVTEEYIRASALTAYHFIGGARVGDVLRRDLTVRRVKGLRVVDSSVFRVMPVSSGPMASVYMLAEFMADRIARL